MKIIMTFIWSFLLVSLLNYVVGSIANIPFNFEAGVIISLGFSVLILVIGQIIPEGTVADH
ncbi:DUF2929 family protein [Sporosarcina siberiensis]|uniref:DUF2929 family protein n=1 Tax=Sporosarcina siberiensis TaxID=1365606 RepID=A0ABW4SIM4_9BACL